MHRLLLRLWFMKGLSERTQAPISVNQHFLECVLRGNTPGSHHEHQCVEVTQKSCSRKTFTLFSPMCPKVLFRKLFKKFLQVVLTDILQDWCSLEPTLGNVDFKPMSSSPPLSLRWSFGGPALTPVALKLLLYSCLLI